MCSRNVLLSRRVGVLGYSQWNVVATSAHIHDNPETRDSGTPQALCNIKPRRLRCRRGIVKLDIERALYLDLYWSSAMPLVFSPPS